MNAATRNRWETLAVRLARLRTWARIGSDARVRVYQWRESLGVSKWNPFDCDLVRPIRTNMMSEGKRLSNRHAYHGPSCGDDERL